MSLCILSAASLLRLIHLPQFCFSTSFLASVLGVCIVLVASPYLKSIGGDFSESNEEEQTEWKKFEGNAIDAVMDLLRFVFSLVILYFPSIDAH